MLGPLGKRSQDGGWFHKALDTCTSILFDASSSSSTSELSARTQINIRALSDVRPFSSASYHTAPRRPTSANCQQDKQVSLSRVTRLGQTRLSGPNQLNMAYIRGKHIVDIPAVSKKIPPNPLLGYEQSYPALPLTVKSPRASLTRNTLVNQALLHDQRCLVTGAVSDQLKPCHLVNTIRVKNSSQQEKFGLKKEVVRSYVCYSRDPRRWWNIPL